MSVDILETATSCPAASAKSASRPPRWLPPTPGPVPRRRSPEFSRSTSTGPDRASGDQHSGFLHGNPARTPTGRAVRKPGVPELRPSELRNASPPAPGGQRMCTPENRPVYHEPLDLLGAFEDVVDLGVAVPALDGEVADVAVAAEDLDGRSVTVTAARPGRSARHRAFGVLVALAVAGEPQGRGRACGRRRSRWPCRPA